MDETQNRPGEPETVDQVLKSEIKTEQWSIESSHVKEELMSPGDIHYCHRTAKENRLSPVGELLQLRVKQEKSDRVNTQQIGNDGIDLMTERPFPVALYKVGTTLGCMPQLDTIPSSAGDPELQFDLSLHTSHVKHAGSVDSFTPTSDSCIEYSPALGTPDDTPDVEKQYKQYRCELCPYSCVYKNRFTRHTRTHTGKKPHKCSKCPYSFADLSALKRHERTHTGEKPYNCSTCPRSFASQSELKRHEISHTGEWPYKCTSCLFRCARKLDLERHMRTHTGDKPYQCSLCSYRCAQKSSLIRHMKTHTVDKSP